MIGVKDKHGKPIEAIGYHKTMGKIEDAYFDYHPSLRGQCTKSAQVKKHMERNGRTFGHFEIKEKAAE